MQKPCAPGAEQTPRNLSDCNMERRRKAPTALSLSPPLLALAAFGLMLVLPPPSARATAPEKRPLRAADDHVRRLAQPTSVVPVFPPATFERAAPFGDAPSPWFAVKSILPDAARPNAVVDVVVWDARRLTTRWVTGTMEPAPPPPAHKAKAGVVPSEGAKAAHVRAAFNGGFRGVHGGYGAFAFGEALLPMKDGLATFIERIDGTNVLATWPFDVDFSRVRSARQNLPPLVVAGRSNASARAPEQWGALSPDSRDPVHGVRSGLCVRDDGLMMYFWGADLSAATLAKAMIDAQCIYGMHLDMNAGLTGFEFCRAKDETGSLFSSQRLHARMSLATFPLCGGRSTRDFFVLEERQLP